MQRGNTTHESAFAKGPTVKWQASQLGYTDGPEETVVPANCAGGYDAAEFLAERWYNDDPAATRQQYTVEIIEPKHWAGKYEVQVDYEPTFYVWQRKETADA